MDVSHPPHGWHAAAVEDRAAVIGIVSDADEAVCNLADALVLRGDDTTGDTERHG